MSSSTLPWLRRDTLEDEFDWKPGRPVNLLSPMLALNCLGRVCSSKSERGDALSGSGSAIETTFVGPLFGLAGSSLSAGLNGRAEPFSEAGGDIFWDSAGDNKCLFRLGLGGASKCRSFSK